MKTRTRIGALILAPALVVVVWIIAVVSGAGVLSLVTSIIIMGLAATSLSIVWGQVGQISLAQTSIFALGAYSALIAVERWEVGPILAFLIATMVGTIAGVLASLPLLRLAGHHFAILTFAIAMVVETLLVQMHWLTGGFAGKSLLPDAYAGKSWLQPGNFLIIAGIIVAVTLGVLLWVSTTRLGDRMRATRDNPILAQTLGINIRRQRIIAFGLAGATAGIAGALYAYQTKIVAPQLFGTMVAISFIAMVLVGGVRSILGGMVGAAVYYLVPHFLNLDPLHNQILFGLILIAVIIVSPQGLIPLVSGRLMKVRFRRSAAASSYEEGNSDLGAEESDHVDEGVRI